MERVAVLLRRKTNEEVKVDKKVDKQIQKYTNPPFAHITIEYQEGDKKIILNDAPIIVRPHEKIGEILKSLQQRLNFSKILGELPEKSS